MPQVLNKRDNSQYVGVYIGRPSKWGNPYKVGRDGTRAEVVEKYRRFLCDSPTLAADARVELRGHDLICWCAPLPCHGDVLLAHANGQ